MAPENYPPFVEELIQKVENEKSFEQLLYSLNPYDLVVAQDCLWNRTMEFSREKGKPLTREQITDRMERTSGYMRRVGCDEPVDYCRANICVNSNPNCAADKLRGSISALRRILKELKH